MDHSTLVSAGRLIIIELATRNLQPRAAVWVRLADTDVWKFWIVPPASLTDNHRFYRIIASIISKHRPALGGVDASDIQMVSETHPAIKGLQRAVRVTGQSVITIKDSVFFGFYLPEAIVLEMNL